MLNSPALKSAVATLPTANSQIPNTQPTTSSSFDQATHMASGDKMSKDQCLSLFADVNFKFDQFNQSKKDHLDGLKVIADRLIELNNMFFRNDDPRFRLKQKQIEELQSLSRQYEENLGQLERGMDEIAQGAGNLNDCRSHLSPTQNQRLNDIQKKLREAGHEIKTVNNRVADTLKNIGQVMKAILENLVLKPAEAIGNGILQALTVIAILLERLGVLKTSQNTPDNSKPSPHDLLASSHVRFAS